MVKEARTEFSNSLGTEDRLLEAAGEIFAEYGYRGATVRQICEKARANLAATLREQDTRRETHTH